MYEAEKAVLFYMTQGLDSSRLNEELFSFEDNRKIFLKVRELKKQGEEVDLVILAEKLAPEIRASYVSALGDQVIRGDFGERYFQEYVHFLISRHKEKEIKARIQDAIRKPDFLPEIKEIMTDYEPEAIIDIRDFSLSSQAGSFQSYIEAKRKLKFWGHEIKSFPILTRVLMGIREIIVFAAKPKIGKSTFALQIASDLHSQGAGILYYDFENSRFNLMARELSRKNSLSFEEMFSGSGDRAAFTEGGILRFEEYKNFCIFTDRKLSIEKIRGHIKQMKKLSGREDVFIVIDSLQKLPMENLRERRAAVDLWLRGLEELKAEEPGLSILLISELSREGGRPKESGDIEYTGHFLLELQTNRTEEELSELGDDNIRKLFIKAARDMQIPAGPLKYEADFRYWRFSETEGPE